jgi:hypothetical protein
VNGAESQHLVLIPDPELPGTIGMGMIGTGTQQNENSEFDVSLALMGVLRRISELV